MRIAFIGDNVSIHQKSLCDELYRLSDGQFMFVATKPIEQERIDLGWNDYTNIVPYAVILNSQRKKDIKRLVEESEIVILGAADIGLVRPRLRKGRLVFKYSERPLKKGVKSLFSPKKLYEIIFRTMIYQRKNLHLLSASAYGAYDYNRLGCFKDRCWKWGYFINPVLVDYVPRNNLEPLVLWVGRFIGWKHCEMVIRAANTCVKKGIKARFEIYGAGPGREDLIKLARELNVQGMLSIGDALPNSAIREKMRQADICLITSDFREGWGVVVNESLSAGCCVIASNGPGASGFLIRGGINGMLFSSCNQNELDSKIIEAIEDPDMRERMGIEAIRAMRDTWSPKAAAEAFIRLSEHLLGYSRIEPAGDGPATKDFGLKPRKIKQG